MAGEVCTSASCRQFPDSAATESITSSSKSTTSSSKSNMAQFQKNVDKIALQKLNCQFGMVTTAGQPKLLHQVVKSERKTQLSNVTVLFAVRQPGWGGCREHALQLSELAAQDQRLALVATVKDRLDEQGLLEFYTDYFGKRSMYHDDTWALHHAITGGTKVSAMGLVKFLLGGTQKRLNKKGIPHSSMKDRSDGWTMGGVLVFNKKGGLVAAMEERVGELLDTEKLQDAIKEARRQNKELAIEDSSSRFDDTSSRPVDMT